MDTKKMGIPIELKEVLQVEKVQQDDDKANQLPSDNLPSTTNTPKQTPIDVLSLPDSPKLITPKRPRVKRTLLNNTPQTPKRAKPEENCSSSTVGESPKVGVVEKKKPRKVTVISTD
ncbi:unnamed protein product [Meloidogyne enterolobii]|uniref:Uncharacterized protein n=1 Tax=Meloidogyne enterolobii TaxID=390850 RepID=A0ACB1A705_MELEN